MCCHYGLKDIDEVLNIGGGVLLFCVLLLLLFFDGGKGLVIFGLDHIVTFLC